MNFAVIEISGNLARVVENAPITSGTVGGTVSLQFDESWDGFSKTIVWRGSGRTIDDINCTCVIPPEVVSKSNGKLLVGIYGTKDGTATPTIWADLGTILPGADPSGDESADPTLPVWEQIPQYVETELRKAKESGEFDGKPFTYEDFTEEQLEALRGEPGEVNIDDTKIGEDAWSSKNTVDKLCPAFTESGSVVTCEPVEGYPLSVQTAEGAAKVMRTGKNLFNFKSGVSRVSYIANGVIAERWGYELHLPAGTYTIHAETIAPSNPYIYAYMLDSDRVRKPFKDGTSYIVVNIVAYTQRYTFEEGDILVVVNAISSNTEEHSNEHFNGTDIQIEYGEAATAYEPFCGGEFGVGDAVPALEGVNSLWADSGEITVTGRADPVAIINNLQSRLGALEAAVVSNA